MRQVPSVIWRQPLDWNRGLRFPLPSPHQDSLPGTGQLEAKGFPSPCTPKGGAVRPLEPS